MHSTPRIQDLPLAVLSLLYWITSQDGLATSIGLTTTTKDLAVIILQQAFMEQNTYDDLADAGLMLHATEMIIDRTIKARVEETWESPRNRQAAQALVRALCERFAIVANALTQSKIAHSVQRVRTFLRMI